MKTLKSMLLIAVFFPLAFVGVGCTSLQNTFSNMTPQDKLNAARDGFGAAVVAYGAICSQPKHPAACDDPKAIAAEHAAVTLANASFAAAQASIDAGKPDAGAITESAVQAVTAIGPLVAALQGSTS